MSDPLERPPKMTADEYRAVVQTGRLRDERVATITPDAFRGQNRIYVEIETVVAGEHRHHRFEIVSKRDA